MKPVEDTEEDRFVVAFDALSIDVSMRAQSVAVPLLNLFAIVFPAVT